MSEIRTNTISDTAGTGPVTLTGQYAAKAWVNFNGTGAIRESGNVSSITDVTTGTYTINLTNNFANANYSTSYGGSRSPTESLGGIQVYASDGTTTTSAIDINVYNFGGSRHDFPYIGTSSFGDLA